MDYSKTLDNAKEKLDELMAKRKAIDLEILALSKIIEGAKIGAQSPDQWDSNSPKFSLQAAPLAEQEPAKFTDKVRLILAKSATPLFPTEIRDRLESMGVEATSPKHLLIHVHKVLERLLVSNEVVQVTRDDKTAYKLLGDMERAVRGYMELLNSKKGLLG